MKRFSVFILACIFILAMAIPAMAKEPPTLSTASIYKDVNFSYDDYINKANNTYLVVNTYMYYPDPTQIELFLYYETPNENYFFDGLIPSSDVNVDFKKGTATLITTLDDAFNCNTGKWENTWGDEQPFNLNATWTFKPKNATSIKYHVKNYYDKDTRQWYRMAMSNEKFIVDMSSVSASFMSTTLTNVTPFESYVAGGDAKTKTHKVKTPKVK